MRVKPERAQSVLAELQQKSVFLRGLSESLSVLCGPEPRAVAMGSQDSAIFFDPVASTTPRGMPAWGPRSARGSDPNT